VSTILPGTTRATSSNVAGLDTPQLIFFVILAVAFVLLLTERLRNDVVAILIVPLIVSIHT